MIADILYDVNLFVDGRGYAGRIKEFIPPVIEAKTIEYQAGGMAAAVDVPMGRINKLTAEATMYSFDRDVMQTFRILPGEQFAFVGRASMVSDDGTKKPVVVTMRGITPKVDPGTWAPGEEMPLKISMSLRYYKLEIDGAVIYEIDPVNYKFIVNGVDQLEVTRQHLAI
ncbi:phage major tail tube protein [Castellaniella sp.]|uniref:phage major tail tube protein n=1 Tax=Castellaniella sp. TaxID=1955812 RepID=UPI002AFE67FA|nr:phage major tail tube protein [Castellaniella sp.]